MAMTHWYFVLAPLVVLAVMSLLRFRGCGFHPSQADGYGTAVGDDSPVAWFRLEDAPGSTVAKNAAGSEDGAYGTAPSPLSAGQPTWHSPAVPATSLTLGINDPDLVLLEHEDPYDFSIRVEGAFVQVPADVPALQDLTEFTLEALVYPDWDAGTLGNYYCVLELAGLAPGVPQKSAGFGLYAGPSDTQNPNSPYSWQVWMGNGSGFQRLEEKKPYNPPDPANLGPGPCQKDQATYLAFTFSQSQGQAFLYLYSAGPGPGLCSLRAEFRGLRAGGRRHSFPGHAHRHHRPRPTVSACARSDHPTIAISLHRADVQCRSLQQGFDSGHS